MAFNALLMLAVYLVIEAFSFALLINNMGSWTELAKQRHRIAIHNPLLPGANFNPALMLHPYIGAVQQPKDDEKTNTEKYRVTEYGFVDDDLPIHQRTPDKVIVAILGGSVANQFSLSATGTLAEELSKSPEFAGREFKFVRLATSGYKQPQQLMTIMYLLSLGAEFDLVINLDGFNEAALPSIDNIPYGVSAAYPRDWGTIVAFNSSLEFQRMAGFIAYLREYQRDVALWADANPLNYSPTAQLVWNSWNQRMQSRIISASQAISRMAEKETTYRSSGPSSHYQSPEEMFQDCIELWRRSSVLLHRVCKGSGIRYFHFLQPNQHFAGSKPIDKSEKWMTQSQGNPNSAAVKACYPIMRNEASKLIENGVAFIDFTDVFSDHPEPIYIDSCCHVNSHGNQIMAKAMGQRICEYISDHH